jgi:hypothetical protein
MDPHGGLCLTSLLYAMVIELACRLLLCPSVESAIRKTTQVGSVCLLTRKQLYPRVVMFIRPQELLQLSKAMALCRPFDKGVSDPY